MVQLVPRSPWSEEDEGRSGDPSQRDGQPLHRAVADARRARGRHATVRGDGFGALLGWTVVGSVVPGLGLLRSGRRVLGAVVLGLAVLLGVAAVALVVLGDPVRWSESIAVNPGKLVWVAVGVGALALVWAALVVVTHTSLRRHADLTRLQRVVCSAVLVCLVGAGLLPAAKAADYALITRQTLVTVFQSEPGHVESGVAQPNTEVADPWAALPRVNVLLIGSDAGADRTGVRPDTMIVASIDTHTGDTVLFSLPRNLERVPFPAGSPAAAAFPHGFYCVNPLNNTNTECLLNGIWTFAEDHAGDYYKGVKNPGLTATMQAAQEITGLTINNYVMIDLEGFKEFVNAIGGLKLDVKEKLPIGGNVENPGSTTGWIYPGVQKLDGYHALWFARSRWSTSDYDRMRRQRCVIGAMAQQADPVTLAENFPAIARAAQRNIQTDISIGQLDAWVQLGQRVQHASVRSLPFTDDVISTTNPDFAKVHALVQASLKPPATTRSSTPSPSAGASGTPAPTPTPSTSSGTTSSRTQAADVRDVC